MDELRSLIRAIKQPALVVSAVGEVLAANAAAAAVCDALVEGGRLWDVLDPRSTRPPLQQWLRHGEPVPARLLLRGPQGAHALRADVARVELTAGPAVLILGRTEERTPFAQLNDRLQRLQREVQYRIAAERERAAALEAERVARSQLERVQRLSAALATALDVAGVLDAIHVHAPGALGVGAVVVSQPRAATGEDADLNEGSGDRLAREVAHPLVIAELERETRFFPAHEQVRVQDVAADQYAPGSAYLAGVMPLVTSPEAPAQGALGLLCARARALCADERTTAELVASLCAQALERARLYDRERRSAETLQRALLPDALPHLENVELAVRYIPASEQAAVGGDWYDAIELGPQRLGLIVGDVAGHGPSAATAMGQVRNALRSLATATDSPGDALVALNQFVCTQMPDAMATVVYLLVDRAAGAVRYANAGHPPPFLLPADGSARYLRDALGPPVGVTPRERYETSSAPFDAHASLVVYSDGLVERRGESIDLGLLRLERATASAATDAETLCAELVKRLVGDEELGDDAVLLVATPPSDGSGHRCMTGSAEEPPHDRPAPR